MAYGFSPKLPLIVNQIDGPYGLLKTIKEVGAQNLKMLVLTNPGERIMNPDFGVGISRYLFSQDSDIQKTLLIERTYQQVDKYIPYISLTNMEVFLPEEIANTWRVIITYFIPGFTTNEKLFLNLSSDDAQGI